MLVVWKTPSFYSSPPFQRCASIVYQREGLQGARTLFFMQQEACPHECSVLQAERETICLFWQLDKSAQVKSDFLACCALLSARKWIFRWACCLHHKLTTHLPEDSRLETDITSPHPSSLKERNAIGYASRQNLSKRTHHVKPNVARVNDPRKLEHNQL